MQQNRRRFIKIAACGLAAIAAPFSAANLLTTNKKLQLFSWQGIALGATASLQLYHHDKVTAHSLIRECFTEIQRLEDIFSLYKANSTIAVLNKNGAINNAPEELTHLIKEASYYSNLTYGAFDITVQPLWQVYAKHFLTDKASTLQNIKKEKIEQAVSLINYKKLHINKNYIKFAKQGMAITLNGIAQGYITDKITELLKQNGLTNILVEMGELRALGTHPNKNPWHIGIRAPSNTKQIIDTVNIENAAIATSGGYGTQFDPSGKHNHIFNPHTGNSANLYQSVSVIAPTATQADALSTAFSILEKDKIDAIAKTQKDVFVHIRTAML